MNNSRITPAYAGRILNLYVMVTHSEDHPRIRGKNCCCSGQKYWNWGSPPHTREEYALGSSLSQNLGITPAYAGRIQTIVMPIQSPEDHPRIRGKNLVLLMFVKMKVGSPPHTREELVVSRPGHSDYWITPAYAGRIRVSLSGFHL